jgi:hypothetical protein
MSSYDCNDPIHQVLEHLRVLGNTQLHSGLQEGDELLLIAMVQDGGRGNGSCDRQRREDSKTAGEGGTVSQVHLFSRTMKHILPNYYYR